MKVLSPKITTSQAGVFYKEVVNDENKVVDKVFLIRYRDEIQHVTYKNKSQRI
jgi:hypothetical protein